MGFCRGKGRFVCVKSKKVKMYPRNVILLTHSDTFQWPTDRCNSGIMVRLSCEKCGCSGQYRKDTLIARYGADIRLPDLRWEISHCERQGQMHDAWHLQGMAREAGCGIPPAG
jgi:hypothetical protein